MSNFEKKDGNKVVIKFSWPLMPLYGDELEHFKLYSEEYNYIPDGIMSEYEKKIESIVLRDNKTLVITTDPVERFNSCMGRVRVVYDGEAQLYGEDGPVKAFDIYFEPEGLEWKGHTHCDRNNHIPLIGVYANGTITTINYWDRKHKDEHVGLLGVEATGVITNINDI